MAKGSKRNQTQNVEDVSQFVQVVEKYIHKAQWTNQELMNAIKVGETQFYRWRRSSSTPRKAIVNRIAIALANRSNEIEKKEPLNLFPGWDRIDGILNELLEAAGYSASVKGAGINSSWDRITYQKAWTLGYTKTPFSHIPEKAGAKPKGEIIVYAEKIAQLLGLHTEWKYLPWDEMSSAIRERKVDAIAPLMLVLPERLFDYRFSEPCSQEKFSLSAVLPSSKPVKYYEELPTQEVKVVYVKGEMGDWGADFLNKKDEAISCQDNQEAVTKLTTFQGKTCVFLSDNITCHQIAKEKQLLEIKVKQLEDFETYLAFALHPDEPKLITAINSAINLVEKLKTASNNNFSNHNDYNNEN